MAARAAQQIATKRLYLGTKETWPIMGIVGFAGTMATVVGATFLMKNPDVQIARSRREDPFRSNSDEGREWVNHRAPFELTPLELCNNSSPVFKGLNRMGAGETH